MNISIDTEEIEVLLYLNLYPILRMSSTLRTFYANSNVNEIFIIMIMDVVS